jgi:hypothetical protein
MATGDKIVVRTGRTTPFEFVTEAEEVVALRIEISGLLTITRNGKFAASFSPHFWTYVTQVSAEDE